MNSVSGYNGDFLNVQNNSSTVLQVASSGTLTVGTSSDLSTPCKGVGSPPGQGKCALDISGAVRIFDQSAGGVSSLQIKESSSSQQTDKLLELISYGNQDLMYFRGDNQGQMYINSANDLNQQFWLFQALNPSMLASNQGGYGFYSGNNIISGGDSEFRSNSAGTVELDSTTFGAYRDFISRKIGLGSAATGSTLYSELTVSGLPTQSSTSTLALFGSNFITGGNASGTFLGANPTSTYNGAFVHFEVNSSTIFAVNQNGGTSSTLQLGTPVNASTTGCIIMGAASGTIGKPVYVSFDSNAAIMATTTRPSWCLTPL